MTTRLWTPPWRQGPPWPPPPLRQASLGPGATTRSAMARRDDETTLRIPLLYQVQTSLAPSRLPGCYREGAGGGGGGGCPGGGGGGRCPDDGGGGGGPDGGGGMCAGAFAAGGHRAASAWIVGMSSISHERTPPVPPTLPILRPSSLSAP